MPTSMERRRAGTSLPDLFDWMVPDFPAMPPMLRGGTHGIRIEEAITDGTFTLSAELPGIDPDEDVDVKVEGDLLTIRAERSTKSEGQGRSEFRYGALARAVRLPAGARADQASADYKKGILTVKVPVAEAGKGARTIKVQRPKE
jgi:HSP20 family protein